MKIEEIVEIAGDWKQPVFGEADGYFDENKVITDILSRKDLEKNEVFAAAQYNSWLTLKKKYHQIGKRLENPEVKKHFQAVYKDFSSNFRDFVIKNDFSSLVCLINSAPDVDIAEVVLIELAFTQGWRKTDYFLAPA